MGSTICTAAPAVPKCTREPDRCRSCFGSRACSVMPRAATASISSTSARGNRMRPSSPKIAPAPVSNSTPDGGAWDRPICSSASSAAAWICAIPASVSGRYCPPSIPARTGRTSSAKGAARMATRASRPPERRDRAGAHSSAIFVSISFIFSPFILAKISRRVWGRAAPSR